MNKTLYLCDGKACEHPSYLCGNECKHTSNEEHAKNPPCKRRFVTYPDGSFWEIDESSSNENRFAVELLNEENDKHKQFLDDIKKHYQDETRGSHHGNDNFYMSRFMKQD